MRAIWRDSTWPATHRSIAMHSVMVRLLLMALLACAPPDGPVPVAFDRTPCTHCRMLVSDPRFAAQIQTEDGEVLDFDDPGCLLQWRSEHRTALRAVWFHHLHEDRWLAEARTAFLAVEESPMGFRL